MGKEWDAFVPQPNFWKEIYRVLKPGGYVLSFAGTRTYDWMVMAVRLAGFEIRDMIAWLYGVGFLNQRMYLYKLIRNSVQWDIGEKHQACCGNSQSRRW